MLAADSVIAAVLTGAMAAAVAVAGPVGLVPRAGSVVVACGLLALAARRRRPLPVLSAVVAVVLVELVAAPTANPAAAFLALMVASYSLGVHAEPGAAGAGLLVASGGVAVAQVLAPGAGFSHAAAISFFVATLVLAPALAGCLVRARLRLAGRVRGAVSTLADQSAARIEQNRATQRDVLRARLDATITSGLDALRPYAAVRDRDDVAAVRDGGRRLLADMRELLGKLRGAGEAAGPTVPETPVASLREQVTRALTAEPDRPYRAPWWIAFGSRRVELLLAAVAVGGAIAAVLTVVWDRLAHPADPFDGLPAASLLIVAPLAAGSLRRTVHGLAGLALCLAGIVLVGGRNSAETLSSAAFAVGSWTAGRVLQAGTAALRSAARTAEEQHTAHRDAAARALREDRARLAREVHDAVGHALTGIVLQATAAARVWDSRPDAAHEHVATLRGGVRSALDELRPLVSALGLDPAPPSGLTGLAALVTNAQARGLRVELSADQPTRVSEVADRAAYRIVQEALINCERHAPGSRVAITVATEPGATIRIAVRNGAPSLPPAALPGPGHGLRGMAERVAELGGTLTAGPEPDGGFLVSAVLPGKVPS